jgi:hypothetical protein
MKSEFWRSTIVFLLVLSGGAICTIDRFISSMTTWWIDLFMFALAGAFFWAARFIANRN